MWLPPASLTQESPRTRSQGITSTRVGAAGAPAAQASREVPGWGWARRRVGTWLHQAASSVTAVAGRAAAAREGMTRVASMPPCMRASSPHPKPRHARPHGVVPTPRRRTSYTLKDEAPRKSAAGMSDTAKQGRALSDAQRCLHRDQVRRFADSGCFFDLLRLVPTAQGWLRLTRSHSCCHERTQACHEVPRSGARES